MTYLAFHAIFILPPLLLLLLTLPRALPRLGTRARWTLPAIALIALLYTTPWDNYLVYRGVWWYGADRVIGTIGWVPIEEYLFFVLQPLLTGAFLYHALALLPGSGASANGSGRAEFVLRAAGAAGFLLLGIAGAFMLSADRTLYLGLILAWAMPVLAAQWALVAPAVHREWRAYLLSITVPTLYLWIADRIAIGAGIWSIAPQYTTGIHLAGLPLEEAVFFLLTNALVVQGVLLFLEPSVVRRTVPVPAQA